MNPDTGSSATLILNKSKTKKLLYMSEQYSKAIQEVLRRKRIFIRRKGLKRIPLCTIIRMLQHQESQTGKVDIEIFQRYPIADALGGGFDWKKTPEGFAYWHDRIVLKKRDIN